MLGKRKADNDSDAEQQDEADNNTESSDKEITVILDLASLEIVKTKKGDFQLLNCDDHIGLMKKHNKNPQDYRPDIIHQELMAVLDSPLNKAGKVKVYVHTEKNVMIEINPKTRIPRTFKRFSGLMVKLLHRLKIRSSDGRDMLLKVVKNPISRHLPVGARCYGNFFLIYIIQFIIMVFFIGFSHTGTLHNPVHFASSLPDKVPIVLIFGAQATRGIVAADHPYVSLVANFEEI